MFKSSFNVLVPNLEKMKALIHRKIESNLFVLFKPRDFGKLFKFIYYLILTLNTSA